MGGEGFEGWVEEEETTESIPEEEAGWVRLRRMELLCIPDSARLSGVGVVVIERGDEGMRPPPALPLSFESVFGAVSMQSIKPREWVGGGRGGGRGRG